MKLFMRNLDFFEIIQNIELYKLYFILNQQKYFFRASENPLLTMIHTLFVRYFFEISLKDASIMNISIWKNIF